MSMILFSLDFNFFCVLYLGEYLEKSNMLQYLEKSNMLRQPFTRQDNTVIQTCVLASFA
ncbi:hypothetical protein GLYMA_02G179950v4 [Glycine max]|nr:hypothetical protein GLYMA_02G179950v4 [Glycine max]KAH1060899.1 hypothetical protein GYH30_004398 [Glycine max]